MAMTNQQQTEAYQFFAIAFGATPGVEYMNQLDEAYTFGLTTQEIVNIYTTKPAFTAQYPTFFSAEQFANALIANVVGNSASDAAKAEAKADIVASLNGGMSRGDVIYNVFTNLANALTTPDVPEEGQWYDTALMLANKVEVARYATEVLLINEADQSILRNVTADEASVEAAKEILEGNGGSPVLSLKLTVGMDDLAGDSGNNIFKAVVGQNALGQQVNTLGSGDTLDGQGGTDTLMAKVTSGVFAGGSYTMPIQAETTSIEIVKLEAVLADVGYSYGRDQVFVNAKDMTDVQQLWSNRSDADLTIMNLTTNGLEKLSDMTIGMAYTGNADSQWGASDMTVYFDQDYLTPEATRTKPVVDFLAMNEDAYDRAKSLGLDPQSYALDGVFFRELQFTLNGTKFNLAQYLGEDAQGTGAEIRSYTEFLAAVQSALVQLKAANPTNAALQTVTASFGQVFKTDVDPVTLVQREGVGIRLTVDGLTGDVANTLSVASTDLEVARAANAIVPNNNRYEIADSTPPTAGEKLGINVALEKVGLAGDGGQLVIGSMNKESGNNWDAVNTVVDGTTSGIEEFYVTVYGSSAKSSSLAGLHSTNNNLRVVTVATDAAQTGTYADLTIGNSNTDMGGFLGYENALKDVQTFDASGFKGDLTLYAALTDQITAKYLNLVDAAPDAPGADNLNFEYTGGTGNDNINLTISADNGAFSGAATREDFLMNATIDGGDGDDMITLAIIDNEGNSFFDEADVNGLAYGIDNPGALPESGYANWYDNQKINANLRIDGGNGNDTIWTPGSGDIIIDGGAGNDTVYADNTGDKAVWAFNYASGADSRRDLDNLQSDLNDKYKVFKTDVKVSFLGFEATARIADVKGVASDLDINQAIKKAINSDPVLSKLLVATDGPSNTLVVTSLIDGERNDDDLVVSLVAPAASALTAGDLNQLSSWYSTPGLTAAGAKTLIDAQVALFNTNVSRDGTLLNNVYNQDFANEGLFGTTPIVGSDSEHTSDNTITGGLGNDVLVLGTGAYSNDTVVYQGFGNGTDTIVNFTASDAQLFEYVYNHSYTQGSTASAGTTVPAVAEQFTVQFGPTTGAGTVVFDGVTVTFGATALTGAAAAAQFANDYNAAGTGIYTATPAGDKIVFKETVPGGADLTDVQVSDFVVGAPTVSGLVVAVISNVDGAPATTVGATSNVTESFVVHFNDNPNATTYSFDGETIPVLAGETGLNIAQAVASGNYTNWTASLSGVDVIFTAKTPNANVADAAAFGGITSEVKNDFADGSDYLDFSAYNAKAVYVDGVLVAGTVAVTDQTYITLVQSTTNEGAYTMTQYTEKGAVDTVVGVIGVADFGAEKAFVAENFIL